MYEYLNKCISKLYTCNLHVSCDGKVNGAHEVRNRGERNYGKECELGGGRGGRGAGEGRKRHEEGAEEGRRRDLDVGQKLLRFLNPEFLVAVPNLHPGIREDSNVAKPGNPKRVLGRNIASMAGRLTPNLIGYIEWNWLKLLEPKLNSIADLKGL